MRTTTKQHVHKNDNAARKWRSLVENEAHQLLSKWKAAKGHTQGPALRPCMSDRAKRRERAFANTKSLHRCALIIMMIPHTCISVSVRIFASVSGQTSQEGAQNYRPPLTREKLTHPHTHTSVSHTTHPNKTRAILIAPTNKHT